MKKALDFDDVLIVPKVSKVKSRKEVSLKREFYFTGFKWENVIPIIAANMYNLGNFKVSEILEKNNMITAIHKNLDWQNYKFIDKIDLDKNIYTIGTKEKEILQFKEFSKVCYAKQKKFPIVMIDVANGYGSYLIETIKKVRNCSNVIIAGNVVTPEGVYELIKAGADIIKVGIGSGSVCTTRLKTGVGYPQFSAILECSEEAHGRGKYIISDGGCKNPGDVAKAFAAGADFVMLGNMLAGHDNCIEDENDIKTENNSVYYRYFGSASNRARKLSGNNEDYKTEEGKEVWIKSKGSLQNTLNDITGGLRSACSYVGAFNLKELMQKSSFIKVNNTHNEFYEKE